MNRRDFASLETGGIYQDRSRSNIKGHFRKKFRLFELEEPLPVVAFRTEKEMSDNYTRILKDIERVLGMENAEVDVNSLFREMLRIENLCCLVGFDERQTTTFVKGKAVGVCKRTLFGGT